MSRSSRLLAASLRKRRIWRSNINRVALRVRTYGLEVFLNYPGGICAILSDELPTAKKIFGDAICWTSGGRDLQEKLTALLRDEPRRRDMARRAREIFLRSGTFDAQAQRIAPFLQSIIRDQV